MKKYQIKDLQYKYFIYGPNGSDGDDLDCWDGSVCYCEPAESEEGRTLLWMIKSKCDWDPGEMNWQNHVEFDAEVLPIEDYPEYYL